MAFTDQDYIDNIRPLIYDSPLQKLVKPDACTSQLVPGNPRTKTQFLLSNRNIVDPNSVAGAVFQASVDNATFATATLNDAVNGIGSAPSAPQNSILFMYYFQFFTDAQVLVMRNNGLRQIGVDPTNATAVSTVPQTLFQVPCYYAAAEALRINSQAYVKFYDLTIGGKGLSKKQMFDNVKAQADTYEKKALELSDYYYRKQDRQKQPIYANTVTAYPGNAMQPRR